MLSAFVSALARGGDVEGVAEAATEWFAQHGLELNASAMTGLLSVLLRADRSAQCLGAFAQWTAKGNAPSLSMMALKIAALAQSVRAAPTATHKERVFAALCVAVDHELEFFGFAATPSIAKMRLDGAIAAFSAASRRTVAVFEALCAGGAVGYLGVDRHTGALCVDVHLFSEDEARFLLLFVFRLKLTETVEAVAEGDALRILTGKGSHTPSRGKRGQGTLRELVRAELASWSPPIRATVCRGNRGMLLVDAADLRWYLEHQDDDFLVE